jgi:hypothetical protein
MRFDLPGLKLPSHVKDKGECGLQGRTHCQLIAKGMRLSVEAMKKEAQIKELEGLKDEGCDDGGPEEEGESENRD